MLCYCFSICLEWNGLGILETSFAAFCDGLAANSALRALDLRNNQINHEGAEELSAALKRNITLRALGMSTLRLWQIKICVVSGLWLMQAESAVTDVIVPWSATTCWQTEMRRENKLWWNSFALFGVGSLIKIQKSQENFIIEISVDAKCVTDMIVCVCVCVCVVCMCLCVCGMHACMCVCVCEQIYAGTT